jgi:hypothetical protein
MTSAAGGRISGTGGDGLGEGRAEGVRLISPPSCRGSLDVLTGSGEQAARHNAKTAAQDLLEMCCLAAVGLRS